MRGLHYRYVPFRVDEVRASASHDFESGTLMALLGCDLACIIDGWDDRVKAECAARFYTEWTELPRLIDDRESWPVAIARVNRFLQDLESRFWPEGLFKWLTVDGLHSCKLVREPCVFFVPYYLGLTRRFHEDGADHCGRSACVTVQLERLLPREPLASVELVEVTGLRRLSREEVLSWSMATSLITCWLVVKLCTGEDSSVSQFMSRMFGSVRLIYDRDDRLLMRISDCGQVGPLNA